MGQEYILQHFFTPTREFLDGSLYLTWAGHRKCDSSHVIGPRLLETYKLVFVIGGKGYLDQGSAPRQQLAAEDAFVLFPRERHYYFADPEDPWELMWVAFNGRLCPSLIETTGITREACVAKHALTVGIHKTMTTIVESLGDGEDVNRLRAIGYFYILITKLATQINTNRKTVRELAKAEVINQAIAFIEQNYFNPIDVDMICRHVNYSRSFVSHAFKMETNMTIPNLINLVRMKKAKLLLETDLSIKEVACSVGIDDSLYFSKVFKKIYGVSPQGFRKEQANERSK